MNISQGFKSLVSIELHQNYGHILLHFVVVFEDAEDRLWNIVHYHVEVNLIRLITLSIKCMFQRYHIWMDKLFHDLELTIFIALVLIHLFNSNLLIIFIDRCLKNYTEAAIANNSIGVVGKALSLLLIQFSLSLFH